MITETISSSSSDVESKTSDMNSKSLLVDKFSSSKKYHEDKSSKKRTKEVETLETDPSSEKF